MSARWRCAVCEAVNDGDETCAACGARRVEAAAPATPTNATPPGHVRVAEEPGSEVPVREVPVLQPEGETPEYAGPDLYDYFDLQRRGDAGDGYDEAEVIDVRPRVRVYGCCLPICLGALVVFLGTATVLAHALMRAL
jgi:hypothetical protein